MFQELQVCLESLVHQVYLVYLEYLVYQVYLVCLVCLVCLVYPESLEEYDLIFRLGCGLESQAVVAADKGAMYSHVGLLVRENGCWQVLHAVPGEADDTGGEEVLKMDSLPLFLRADRAVSVCVMRYDTTAEALQRVREEAFRLYGKRLPFDHRYLLSDSSEVYCTEYVTRVFRKIGVELAEDRNHRFPMVEENLIYPIDLTQNLHLKTILHLLKKK